MNTLSLSGSCLCGAIQYSATGQSKHFFHCHCSRCRKASGTGHSSNLFLQGTLNWKSGEDSLTHYKVPEAERFTNTFCRVCGSRMPRTIENIGMIFIPAGTLDDEPDIGPQARIFANSRAGWSCSGENLPEFDEYAG